jgi:hypothetical protein
MDAVERVDGAFRVPNVPGSASPVLCGQAGTEPVATSAAPDSNPFAHFTPLDWIQLALDLFGFIPVFGEVGDLANAIISALRGDWSGAGLSLAAMWPAGLMRTGRRPPDTSSE